MSEIPPLYKVNIMNDKEEYCRKKSLSDKKFDYKFNGAGIQRHRKNHVGNLFRITDHDFSVGGFWNGRIKEGDLVLCLSHAGDCFEYYMFVEEYDNGYIGLPKYTFGSYGIGDAEKIEIPAGVAELIKRGEHAHKPGCSGPLKRVVKG